MKKSFSLLELLLTIFILTLISSFFFFKQNQNRLDDATKRLELYLKYVRYQALIDDKYDDANDLWHKKRWTLKFFRCRKSVGGLYYSIYSDNNMKGQPSLEESLSDPLTNKKIYSSNKCEENNSISKYVLLTKEYGINKVNISCNSTSSLGQLSFGVNGKVFSKLSTKEGKFYDYEIKKPCEVLFYGDNGEESSITIEPRTAYSYKKNQ